MVKLTPEAQYELTRDQLAAHIDYEVACEIADGIHKTETAIAKVPELDREKVRRILARIAEVNNA